MWRKYGDVPYILLIFAIFSLEVLSLAFATWSFSRHLFGFVPYKEIQGVLVGAVAVTAAALALLSGYILAYHALSLSRERRSRQRVQMWTERWIQGLFGDGSFPEAPLSPEAQEAAIALRELVGGDQGMELAARLEEAGVGQSLVRRLGSRRRTVRLDALETLARARLPTAFAAVNYLLHHPQPVVRLMAGRAAARTLAIWNGSARDVGVISFADSLAGAELPAGAVTEVLILLQDAAPAVIARMMADPNLSAPPTRACLDAVGRLGLVQLAYEAGSRITHANAEVRAAALRALGRLRRVPARARDAVVIALADDTEFVRIQAARAAAFVQEENALTALYESLGDPSWWVRRASAESLLGRGDWGVGALQKAAASHPDRYAKDMAAQVLLDAGLVVAGERTRIGEAQ
jgi:HEAT repeat protein